MGSRGLPVRRSRLWKLSSEEFRALVSRCGSVRQILDEAGMTGSGAYSTVRRRMETEGMDYEAFAKAAMARPQKGSSIPLSEVMVEGSTYRRHNLKRRIIEEGLIEYECAECGQGPEWQGKPMVLVIDHKNGVSNDHRKKNLRFLCPNCNSQTPTFSGRNNGRSGPDSGRRCVDCGEKVWRTSSRCRKCAPLWREKRKRGD